MSSSQAGNINPILAYTLIFSSSLIAAIILYGSLSSTGIVESKGIQLGGAAAGFVIVFHLANRVFHSLQKLQIDQTTRNEQRQIDALKQEIDRLKMQENPNIECPNNFESIISKDFGVGFSKPRHWRNHPEQHVGIYMQPLDEKTISAGFRGNITVTSTPLDQLPGLPINPEDIPTDALKGPFLTAIKTYSGEGAEWSSTFIANRRAMSSSFSYSRPENPESKIIVEGVTVLDEKGHRLFVFALHESELRAEESSQLFRQLLSTVKFLS